MLALALAAGCRESRGEAVVVEFWAMGREGEVVEAMVPDFERDNPGLRIDVQQIPWSAAHEKLLTAYVGDAMPDVVQLGNTWLPEFVLLGALEPLDDRIAASAVVRRDDYFAGILDTNVIDGSTVALPWYVDTRVLFYRRDLFAAAGHPEPPATWADWMAGLEAVKRDLGSDRYAILLPMTEWEMPVILALQRGAALLRDGDRYGDFASAPFRDGFERYVDLFRRGLAPRAGEAQIANLYQDFATGYFAEFVSGPWNLAELANRLPAALADAWTTAPMPAAEPGTPGLSLAGGASLALVRTSPRKDAAWRWIEYLADPNRQVEFHRRSGDLPARTSAWNAPELTGHTRAQAFRAQLAHVRATPKIAEWERIAAKIGEHADAAIRERATIDEALARLDHDVDRILEKRRWTLERRAAAVR